jgi:predicted transglutaminase-like cysteine proteinase
MESRTTARLHPEWNSALADVNAREAAMNRDSLATTHPVVQHIETVDQASQAFGQLVARARRTAAGYGFLRACQRHPGKRRPAGVAQDRRRL